MFTYFYHSRGKRYRAKIIYGWYDRSFWYRHNACSFPSSWNSICGEIHIKYNAKNVSKLFDTYLKYSWCSVIWASGVVGIHMLKRTLNLILVCIEPLKVILLSRRSIQNKMNLPMFLRKIGTVKTIEELIQFIYFASSVHWGNFLCVKPVLNWANVFSPNILWTVWQTMIHFSSPKMVRTVQTLLRSQMACNEMQASAQTCSRRTANSMIENVG